MRLASAQCADIAHLGPDQDILVYQLGIQDAQLGRPEDNRVAFVVVHLEFAMDMAHEADVVDQADALLGRALEQVEHQPDGAGPMLFVERAHCG